LDGGRPCPPTHHSRQRGWPWRSQPRRRGGWGEGERWR
jgi:hypothetical protein